MDYEQVAAFLGGSVGTIIIKGLIDYFSKRDDHKRQLEKLTYEKKLKIAEDAIAFFSHYRYNVVQMKSGLSTIRDAVQQVSPDGEFPDLDLSLVQDNLQRVGNMITNMFGPTYQSILAMNLYFDFSGSKYFKVDNLLKLNASMAKTKAIDNDIAFWSKASEVEYDKGNEEAGNSHFNTAVSLFDDYQKNLEEVIAGLELDSFGAEEIVEVIKAQIKIY